ncbi:E3 SUMO-protein ligase RanBP2-like isoform X2 [Clavelina lepadiformis]|uniref:E3 SUMO-protein ligase RanBP2-like isoform X2 n=1 Tax=Clavelina lepadiformis TaxID=159417 RepID=UPI004041EA99
MVSSLSVNDVSSIIDKTIKSTNPRDLPLKGLYLGRLLNQSGQYQDAIEWIVKYLKKYDRDAAAYRLLGDCYEKLLEYEAAMRSYKQSLQVKPNQYDLVLHVVELFLNPGPTQNPNKAQVWLDKVAVALPGDARVFKMKMELLLAQQAKPKELEEAILHELKKRPTDVSLHIQYVTFMRTQDRLADALVYCNKISNTLTPSLVEGNSKWNSCVVNILKENAELLAGRTETKDFTVVHCLFLEALSNLVRLKIADNKHEKALEKLALMDRFLWSVAAQHCGNEWQTVIEEIKAQFCWLVATLLIDQAQRNILSWPEASKLAVFFYAYNTLVPEPNLSSAWAVRSQAVYPNMPERLHKNAGFRISQCCHMLQILKAKAGDSWPDMVQQVEGSELLGKLTHRCLFGDSRETRMSFLCNAKITCKRIASPNFEIISKYDDLAAASSNLQVVTWMGLQWSQNESDFLSWSSQAFPNLKMAPSSTTLGASLLSLNLTDVDAFIAGCVFTTKKKAEIWNDAMSTMNQFSLSCSSLPVMLCRRLTTELQEAWWNAAVKFTKKSSNLSASDVSKLKPVLQRGLECLRGVGNHGLETVLLTKLAKYFAAKAFSLHENSGVSTSWYIYQRRAAMYWSAATTDLIRISEGRSTHRHQTKDQLFPSVFKELSDEESKSLLSEAYMCHGELAAQENRIDEALSYYGRADIPQASFSQAHIYKRLADSVLNAANNKTPVIDADKKHEQYIKRRRHCLEVTLSRLQKYPDEDLHERTVRLLSSPHVTPPRTSGLNKSGDYSLLDPSKQSTPKANESILSTLIEKDSVTNLVDTITTLTSAMSSLQMEMGHLREENSRMRQSSLSQQFTPQRSSISMPSTNQVMTPTMNYPGQVSTPHYPEHSLPVRPEYIAQNNMGTPQSAQTLQYMDRYQQQAYHNQLMSSPHYNYASLMMGSRGTPTHNQGYQGITPQYMSDPGYGQSPSNVYVTNNQQQQPVNVLAASLQNKELALQQRLGSVLSAASSSTVTPMSKVDQQPSLAAMYPTNSSNNTFQVQQKAPSPQLYSGGASAETKTMIQKLLLNKSSVAATSSGPAPVKEPFLSKFVNPKSPGTEMKFQSPEQMDRENQELEAQEQADEDTSHLNDTGPHFEPIITLPDSVEVRTGEEEEEVVLTERCKLFRWDDSQWKERGIGDMKILRHVITGKSRLLMRREQVHKICCNHVIQATTSLSVMAKSDRAIVWYALDFAEDEPKNEQFAARFKNHEIAIKFKDAVNEIAESPNRVTPKEPVASFKTVSKPVSEPSKTNTNTTTQTLNSAAAKFKFEMPRPSPVISQVKPQVTTESEKPKESVFGNLAGAMSSAGFSGFDPNGGIKLGAFKKIFDTKQKPKEQLTDAGSGDLQSKEISSTERDQDKEEEEEPHDQSDHSPDFKPIVDLPQPVKVLSGEENEEVVFSERAKLYRFNSGEWKERGLGDMKILKHKETGKHRVVMRREQVLKICANHHIASSMALAAYGNLGKAWMWTAFDHSDVDAPAQEMFAVRFKTSEQAKEFQDAFVKATLAGDATQQKAPTQQTIMAPTTPSKAASAFLHKEMSQSSQKSPQSSILQQLLVKREQPGAFQPSAPMPSTTAVPFKFGTSSPSPSSLPAIKFGASSSSPSSLPAIKFGTSSSSPSSLPAIKFGATTPATPVNLVSSSQVVSLAPTTQSATLSQGGFNFPAKPAGSWQCPDCCVTNGPEHQSCPCCQCRNPSLPEEVKKNEPRQPTSPHKVLFKFGTDISTSVTAPPSGITFGIQASSSGKPPISESDTSRKTGITLAAPGGFNFPSKPAGSWQCPDCCVTNGPEHQSCPCCQCRNPNLPEEAKKNETSKPTETSKPLFSFGTGQPSTTPTNLPFKFGAPKLDDEENKEESKLQHPTLQRAGGHQASEFVFGSTGMSFGNNTSSNNSVFGITPQSNIFTTSTPPTLAKADFPITKDEEENESSDAESYSTYEEEDEESEDYDDDDDDDDVALRITYESPMSKVTPETITEEQLTSFDGGRKNEDEVVCLGEILPSKELQDKAKHLQLPPHFYNYLEKAGGSDDESVTSSSNVKPTSQKDEKTVTNVEATLPSKDSGFTFGSGILPSFAELAAGSSGSGFRFNANRTSSAFQPDTKPMFSSQDPEQSTNTAEDGDNIHVTPIVDLPQKVTMVTGEEGETTMFSKRAKLYRYDEETSQWKERGLGDICIKHDASSGRFRILMRRQQVLKVCANHLITAEMKLIPFSGSEQMWLWVAADFSEDQSKPNLEKFAVKFKTPEFAQEFKQSFEECQLLLKSDGEATKKSPSLSTSTLISNAEKMKSELGFFKDKLSVQPKVDLENTFTENLNQTGVADKKFDMGNLQLTPLVKQHEKNKKDKMQRDSSKRVENAAAPDQENDATKLEFAKIGLSKFEFKLNKESPKVKKEESPRRGISICSATSDDSQPDIHFEPIIQLPEKVVVPTGEENSEVLFEERAKLYVFDSGKEWKERGLGNIHVLQDVSSCKIRLVMRREQVLKVCLNHFVTSDMKFAFKEGSDHKVLLWAALDFSDPDKIDGEMAQFAVRFKSAEIAEHFLLTLEQGKDAADDGRLVDPISLSLSRSLLAEPSVLSEDGDESRSSNISPVKPTKPMFSFSNMESPFTKKDTKFGDFVFGNTPQSKPPVSTKFAFDTSSISFNFGSTSTPTASALFQPQIPTTKPVASKSLFGIEDSTPSTTTENTAPVTTSSKAMAPFAFTPPSQSPFRFGLAAANAEQFKKPDDIPGTGTKPELSSKTEPQAISEITDVDDDVIFVWEATPSDDQRRRAEKLMLPPTFFLYENDEKRTDVDSDEEETILDYMDRRDNPNKYASSSSEEEEDNESDQTDDAASNASATETPAPEEKLSFAAFCQTDGAAEKSERPQSGGNLFQSYAGMTGFSFASMATTEGASKHAFGSRKDAAFNVSETSKVLFSGQEERSDDADPESFNPEYKPALSEPPPLVEVKTGEEDEEILFKERCKLFRFDDPTSSWKERGLGDIKILFHPGRNWYRVVMRREQVLKLCANHMIMKDTKLFSGGEKGWMYVAQDMSGGQTVVEKFTVRFKNPQIAENFKEVFEKCQASTSFA